MHDGVNFTIVVCACVCELFHSSEILYFTIEFGVLFSGYVVVEGLVYQCRVMIPRQVMASDMVDNTVGSGSGVVTHFEMVYGAIMTVKFEGLETIF